MTNYREIIRLYFQEVSQRSIAASCGCSRNTVAKIQTRVEELQLQWPLNDNLNNEALQKLLFPEKETKKIYTHPDYEYIHKEMAKCGVNLTLLWQEYCDKCRQSKETHLMYSQFCWYYQVFTQKNKATMHVHRKPGERTEVDWAGQKAFYIDPCTGEKIEASVFVGVLSSSKYAYVEAFLSQNLESWIAAHVNMFRYFGGTTRIITPDNLKTGVEKVSWHTTEINRTYLELAEHYGVAVLPARVRKPKDKPNVENAVSVVSTWILASIRNQKTFSLYELNGIIKEKLKILNEKPFQKIPGSRKSVFENEEKIYLNTLPPNPYELATWKIATVQLNYHISVDHMFYSVPYEYIKRKVDVRLTRKIIEIFFNNHRIASHVRLVGPPGQYSTVVEHMPEKHQKSVAWTTERFIRWAEGIGTHTAIVIKAILSSHKIEQQGYRSCLAMLKLADKYSVSRLEAACCKALSYTPRPGYKNVKTILSTNQDKVISENTTVETKSSIHGFTRGAEYYGRKS